MYNYRGNDDNETTNLLPVKRLSSTNTLVLVLNGD